MQKKGKSNCYVTFHVEIGGVSYAISSPKCDQVVSSRGKLYFISKREWKLLRYDPFFDQQKTLSVEGTPYLLQVLCLSCVSLVSARPGQPVKAMQH